MLRVVSVLAVCAMLFVLGGCVRAAKDTTGFAVEKRDTVAAGYEDTWHAAKRVLLEQGYELYTRDKRGIFVAYTTMNRRLLQPKRVKYTVELGMVNEAQTDIVVESVRQSYGVTLTTDPDWHDRPTEDDGSVDAILAAVKARATGTEVVESAAADSAVVAEEAETL